MIILGVEMEEKKKHWEPPMNADWDKEEKEEKEEKELNTP
jgi:hypothetical protein